MKELIEEFKNSFKNESLDKGAMSSNDIIEKLKEFESTNKLVVIEMNNEIYTSDFDADSWRGSYNLPAIGYSYDDSGVSIETAIDNLNEVNGMEVTGYKGGEYKLDADDPIFVANYGESNNCTAIIDVVEIENYIVCLTKEDMYWYLEPGR